METPMFGVKNIFENGFEQYNERLKTFDKWNGKVNKRALAYVGFLFTGTGEGDKCVCHYCRGILYNWEKDDNPFAEHKRFFPACRHVQALELRNRETVKPEYKTMRKRLDTYKNFTGTLSPNVLACAGFYYTGYADRVQCFHCGMGFLDWSKDDDPFETHVKLNPVCTFVNGLTDFDRLGILINENLDIENVGWEDDFGFSLGVVDQRESTEYINETSSLFQELLKHYDEDIIRREMTAMMLQNKKPVDSALGFQSFLTKRQERSDQRLKTPCTNDQLREENEEMKKTKVCKLCKENNVDMLFLPCGHLVCCSDCSVGLPNCPMCKVVIKGTVKVYRN